MKKDIPLISIVIPVYNVEEYLERCITSVLKQTYTKLEIILVDDGSTDGSKKICDDYALLDSRITVIHKKNGGLSDARNKGLDNINGQLVSFIDSDDWVDDNYIEVLYRLLNDNNSEIAIGTYDVVKGDEKSRRKKNQIIKLDNLEAVEMLLYQKKFTTSAWGKLFNAELFKDIRFPVGKLYEDVETIYKVIKKAQQVVFTNTVLYHYFQRETGIVRTKFYPQKMDYVKNCERILSDVKENYPSLVKAAISRLLWANVHVLVYLEDRYTYCTEFNYLWENVKKYRKIVLFDCKANFKNRIVALVTYLGDKRLRKIFILSKKI